MTSSSSSDQPGRSGGPGRTAGARSAVSGTASARLSAGASAQQSGSGGLGQLARSGCGALLLATGLFLTVGASAAMADSADLSQMVGNLALLLFVGLAPIGLGIWLLSSFARHRQEARRQREEKLVLQVAGQRQGQVSPVDLARLTALSLDAAHARLEEMARQGYAERDVNDNGAVVYRFPELLPPPSARMQEDPLGRAIEEEAAVLQRRG